MNNPRFRDPQSTGSGRPRFRNPNNVEVNGDAPLNNDSMHVNHGLDSDQTTKPLFYRPPQNQQYSRASNQKNFRPPRDNREYPRPQFNKYSNSQPQVQSNKLGTHPGTGSQQFIHSNNNGQFLTQSGSSSNMVLSKIQEPVVRATPCSNDVLTFLREFKPLECNCCLQVIGFQHRMTGVVMCKPDCIGTQNSATAVTERNHSMHHQAGSTNTRNGPTYQENMGHLIAESGSGLNNLGAEKSSTIQKEDSNRFVRSGPRPSANAPVEDEYRHISSLHKYEAGPAAQDTVDHKMASQTCEVRSSVNPNDTEAPGSEKIVPSETPKINPFFKTFPSVKQMIPTQVASNASFSQVEDYPEIYKAPEKAPIRSIQKEEFPVSRPAKSVAQPLETRPVEQVKLEPESVNTIKEPEPTAVKQVMKEPEANPPMKPVIKEPATTRPPKPIAKKTEPIAPEAQKPKYSWLNCVFSPNLTNGADVKVAFVWGLNKYQLQAAFDEEPLLKFQEKIMAYIKDSQPMTRKPVINEVVLGIYGEEYYRGRVTEVKQNGCQMVFVDYGDTDFNTFEQIYEPNDDLMQFPISSITIILKGVPKDCKGVKAPKSLNDHVFSVLTLEIDDELLKPTEELEHEAKLWVDDESTLNKLVHAVVIEARIGSAVLTIDPDLDFGAEKAPASPIQTISQTKESWELYELAKLPVETLKETQEGHKAVELKIPNGDVFSWDDTCYKKYFFQDLPVLTVKHGSKIRLEVSVDCKKLDYVECIPLDSVYEVRRENLSKQIEEYVTKNESSKLSKKDITPMKEQMFLIKWPTWCEIEKTMIFLKGKERWQLMISTGEYKRNEADDRKYQGKWFRALFLKSVTSSYIGDSSLVLSRPLAFQFYLVDLGKELIVPDTYVHKITAPFMVPPQLCMNMGLLLDHENQYDEKVHKKWSYILKPGLKLYVEAICDARDITYVKLLDPSESWCNAQYSDHLNREEKRELETLRNNVEAVLLKTLEENACENIDEEFFQKELDKLREDHMETKKIERCRKKYSGVGMFSYNRIRPVRGLKNLEFSVEKI